jgi:RsmE family RNA methyltransferase
MNLLLIKPEEIEQGCTVILNDRRHLHIRDILKCQSGDSLRIGIVNGPSGTGIVRETDNSQTILLIDTNGHAPPRTPVDLILALPRPIMLKRILSQAATLGVGHIYLINANRVEKSFFNASMVKEKTFEEPLLLGLEQAMDTRLPEVTVHPRFRPFVEDHLPTITNEYKQCLIAHPEGKMSLTQSIKTPLNRRVLLAIGPEGGWVDFEIEKFKEQDFTVFHMGKRILRVETAVTALLAQLDLLRQMK